MANNHVDYYISAVRYNAGHSHIDKVLVHANGASNHFGPGVEWSRQDVLSVLDQIRSVVTIYLKNGTWYMGEDVRAFPVGNNRYIRTDSNNKAADNLGNLQEF